jgi:hypothetical protein
MNSRLSFQHQYEIQILDSVPDESQHHVNYFYPQATPTNRPDAVKFLVTPQFAKPWVGVVSPGPYVSCHVSNGIYSCPHPRLLCVVSGGQAIIIDSEIPCNWSAVPCTPVLDVKVLVPLQLIVFSDFSRVTAWGRDGLAWTTRPLAFKGLRITHADKNYVYGTTLDLNGPIPLVPFKIYAETGRTQGGCWLLDTLIPTSEASRTLLASWFDPATRR